MKVQSRIEEKLSRPGVEHLEVINESAGHNVPAGSETHFRVVIVTADFVGRSRVARRRIVHRALADELQGPVHALAVETWTPEEWVARGHTIGESPKCHGGDGSLPSK